MSKWPARAASLLLLLPVLAHADDAADSVDADTSYVAMTEEDEALVGVGTATVPVGYVNKKDPWLDRLHGATFNAVWRSAMHVDHWFGSTASEVDYMQTSGSIAPSLLYDEFDGFQPRLRFQVDVPLPQLNKSLHAFIGRVNADEYVTERKPDSGAIARQYGPVEDDETIFGIRYRQPEQGGRFQADAGLRIRSPLDPFVKGSWRFQHGSSERTLFSFRETLFWQNSEGAGETTRLGLERILDRQLLVRYTLSGTRSQKSPGLKGYSSILLLHGMTDRRAVAFEVGVDGATQAEVPLHDYGFKAAYRQSMLRRWLIMEVRTSVDWPKDFRWQHRHASLGLGVGCEMLLGTDEFLARPVTF